MYTYIHGYIESERNTVEEDSYMLYVYTCKK